MNEKNIVSGGPGLEIPTNLSFGKYVIDKWRENCAGGDKIAMINGKTHRQTSYRELLRKTVNLAHGLKRMGLAPGNTVALCAENSTEYISATIAAISVGATMTMINVKYTKNEIVHALSISKPRLIFSSKAALETKLNILRQVSCIEHIVQLNDIVTAEDVIALSDLEVPESVDDFEPEEVCGALDTAFVFYSSGTTGCPKAVMLTHFNVIYGAKLFNYANKNNAKVLTILPWYHVYGLLTTIQYIVSGNLVVFLTELNPDTYLATIEKYQIAEMPTVPTIVVLLAKSPEVHKYDLSSLKVIWCSAAPIPADIINSAKKNLPNCKGIYQTYGLTESSLSILKEQENPQGKLIRGSSCGVPLPGIAVKVVDVITREKLGPNQQGEIYIKSPSVMKGYVGNEVATREAFDVEGYLQTGDVGFYDDEGCFYIIDRCKDIIKYKGQQVAPAVVESVVMQHEEVLGCGVVGAPDELAGELPTAFVVKKPGSDLTEQQLLDFTTERLSPVSRLRGGIIFVEEIPRNSSGKILRRELRNILRKIK